MPFCEFGLMGGETLCEVCKSSDSNMSIDEINWPVIALGVAMVTLRLCQ